MDDPYIPEMPSEIIQTAILDTLIAYDWSKAKLGIVPTIRLARRNYAQPEQYPCITIRWQEDAIREAEADNGYMTSDETYVDMRLILEIEADALDEETDPTGFRIHTTLAFHSLRALKSPDGDLMANWADNVADRGRTEDADSTNDEGRFDQAIAVLYRVATEDPSRLLARGMNA